MESNILALIGIILTLSGAVFACIASVQRPTPITDPGSDVPIKEMLDSEHKARLNIWENYPDEQRLEELKKSEEIRVEAYKQLTGRINEAWWKDRLVMVKRNTFGLLLIVAGSVLQGVAVLVS